MLKRLSLFAVVLALPSLLGNRTSAVLAASGDALPTGTFPLPTAAGGFEGLPDLDSAAASPRFLTVSGNNNFTIPGDAAGVARNLIRLTFTPAGPTSRIQIAVYDADARGHWDQRVDGVFVLQAPETEFEVFPDPTNGGAAPDTSASNRVADLKASSISTDEAWTELLDQPASTAAMQKGLGADGRYHFLVRTTLEDPVGGTLSGYEINGYKLAYNGTYLLPANSVLGFTGGAIDGLVLLAGGAQLLTTNDPYPNEYTGDFDFKFDPSNFCVNLKASNGDADWNKDIPAGTTDTAPTGVPPDNGGQYINPQPPMGLRDATQFKLGAAVQYQFLKPDASAFFSSATDTTVHRPSIDQSMEGATHVPPDTDPFQTITLDKDAMKAFPGTWKFHWAGLDAHNSVFIKFNQDFGTTPKVPTASGRIWCDANTNGLVDQGETTFPGVLVTITPVGGGAAKTATTGADGTWSVQLTAGLYELTFANPGCATPRLQAPFRFTVDACNGGHLDVPMDCTVSASGHVFCDNDKDKVFSAGDTALASSVTVRLEKQGSAEFKEVTSTGTTWTATGLSFGTWSAFVKTGQFTDSLTKTSTQPQTITLSAQNCNQTGVDFGYVCTNSLCIRLFCDPDKNCLFDQADEPLFPVIVKVTPFPANGSPGVTGTTGRDGRVCFDLAPGNYTISIDPNQAALAGATLRQGPIDFVTVPSQGTAPDVLYCYDCLGSICGTVYLNKINCNDRYEPLIDQPLPNITVNLWQAAAPPPAAAFMTTTTGADGGYCFNNLPAGAYIVQVAGGQPTLAVLTPTNPTVRTPTLNRGEHVNGQDFGYCAKARLYGKVFKENCRNKCDGVFDANSVPLAGVTVSIDGINPVRPPAAMTTNATGDYSFDNLDPGVWRVQVNGADPIFVNLTPTSAISVQATLLAGDQVRMDFPWCECLKSRIFGYVFKNPPCTCDGTYDVGTDTPLAGVKVSLDGSVNGGLVHAETHTDAAGFYEFKDLFAGTYTVTVDGQDPVVVNLTPSTPGSVGPIVLQGGDERRVDFGFCTERLCGFLFRTPPCITRDGQLHPSRDSNPIPGVQVHLLETAGPRQGMAWDTLTGPDGGYCFEDLGPGTYEVSVPAGQAALDGLTAITPLLAQVTLEQGRCRFDVDFGFSPPGHQKLWARVFWEPRGFCDGKFDDGRDHWFPRIEVFVAKAGDNDGYLASGFTDDEGRVSFPDLPVGDYVIYVGSNQPALVGFKPSTPNCYRVHLGPCDEACAPFGWCKTCVPTPCCEGDLHQVLVGTAFWVGDCARSLDLTAKLLHGCTCGCDSHELDALHLNWRATFPGELQGANDLLSLVDVKVKNGVAYVVLKVTAQGDMFRDGIFGRDAFRLLVTLNGVTNSACATFRCESFRPGMLFTWDHGCPELPRCGDGWHWDGRSCWDAPWLTCGSRSSARFLVLDTWSHETWDCQSCSACTQCTACPRCTELLPVHIVGQP